MKNIIWILAFSVTLFSCGMEEKEEGCSEADKSHLSGKPECQEKEPATTFTINGSIASAFGITVDDTSYQDIEEFYTLTAQNLNQVVQDAGMIGYTAVFSSADLGFKDLTNDMVVFVSAVGNRGYATKTSVAGNDTFRVTFPIDAAGDTYQVKAVKKVSILASKLLEDGVTVDVKKFCWNFSALDLNVPYDIVDKPVIISSFVTSLTLKDCTLDTKGSFNVPTQQN